MKNQPSHRPGRTALALALASVAGTAQAEVSAVRLATGLDQPTYVTAAPGDDSRLFILEKTGAIRIFDRNSSQLLAQPFLSLPQFTASEAGLVGLAFAPDYASSGVFYVTQAPAATANVTLTRYHVSGSDPNLADASSAENLLQLAGAGLHDGGWIGFHPDSGLLYMTVGDADGLYPGISFPHVGHAQDLTTLRGKILRLEVGATGGYSIPADNPFAAGGGLPEIWSVGVRNPWRGSFDLLTHDFFFGDVGNNAREEINLEPAGSPGGRNYGWSTLEGTVETGFDIPTNPPADSPMLIDPLFEYPHSGTWGSSVIGGYVYRGPDIPDLTGSYLFGDFITGRLWAMENPGAPDQGVTEVAPLFAEPGQEFDNLSSFGQDNAGRAYVLDFSDGELYHLTSPKVVPEARFPLAGASIVAAAWLWRRQRRAAIYTPRP